MRTSRIKPHGITAGAQGTIETIKQVAIIGGICLIILIPVWGTVTWLNKPSSATASTPAPVQTAQPQIQPRLVCDNTYYPVKLTRVPFLVAGDGYMNQFDVEDGEVVPVGPNGRDYPTVVTKNTPKETVVDFPITRLRSVGPSATISIRCYRAPASAPATTRPVGPRTMQATLG